jgi:hypothetical protein
MSMLNTASYYKFIYNSKTTIVTIQIISLNVFPLCQNSKFLLKGLANVKWQLQSS